MTQRKNADRELLAAGKREVFAAVELQFVQFEVSKQQDDAKRSDALLQGLNALIDRTFRTILLRYSGFPHTNTSPMKSV